MRKILATVVVMSIWTAPALAQDKAGAEAAFRQGRKLMDEGKLEEACKQFQLSNELDPALGTLLNLADCHEKTGKTASAWAEFTEVADKASHDPSQKTREDIARKRANALEPKLVRLKITVAADAPAGLTIKRNGEDVSRGAGVALPVDPGSYEIVASATGYQTWTKSVEVKGAGQTISVEVPVLQKVADTGGTTTTGGGTTTTTGTGTGVTTGGQADDGSSRRRTRQIIAASTGGVGVISLGVGLLFGNSARGKNNDSNDFCDDDNVCTDEGFDLREDAQSAATKANIFVGVGLAAVAAGVVLWVTAPEAESAAGSATLSPTVAPGQVGLSLSGSF